jgi:hypothetical protein
LNPFLKRVASVVYLILARGLCRPQSAFVFLGIDSESEDLPYYTEILSSCQKMLKALCDLISDIILLGNERDGC